VTLASLLAAAVVVAGPAPAGADAPAVRVWEATETIPTYEEGPPDVNPPFDLFSSTRFNYPYTIREGLTDRRAPKAWRTLNLENEHLRVSVLPDLGGRLWRCIDKANGASLFYANPSLKFANVAYRGVWATFGIEFNFPVSHNWVTSSPVDFATRTDSDGSAAIVVGNVDLVYGMQWRVELRLRPGRAVLEQTTTLYNRSALRHRFYWWTNAAVEAWDDSRLVYPMDFTASHGFTEVNTWPVSADGVDLSRPVNHLKGPVSLFSYGSREAFMGVYHPRTRAGVAHWSDPAELPAKKVWSWGADADGRDWRKALSDNDSAEVEIQAGLFRNQETYAFLEPQQQVRFREYWMPVREIGGFVRATPDAVLNVERGSGAPGAALVVGLNVTRDVRGGRLRVKEGDRVLADDALDLTPAGVFEKSYAGLPRAERYTVEAVDGGGRVLVVHTEGGYDNAPRSEVQVGPQAAHRIPPADARGEGDFLELGTAQELDGKLLRAFETYEDGLRRFPASVALAKASGRLAVGLKRYDDAVARLEDAVRRRSNDGEARYYLGVARLFRGEREKARVEWERAVHAETWRAAALLELARLSARDGDAADALARIADGERAAPGSIRAGAAEVILLRRSGRRDDAVARAAFWRGEDPTDATLRNEAVKLGQTEHAAALWRHLAGDPQRVLEAAIDYMAVGAWGDALELLDRDYPTGEGVFAEPGLLAPQAHPEVAYYRGYCREQLGASGRADYDAASRMSTAYVFPQRAESLAILRRAVEANPDDASAHFLLGSLYLSGGIADRAVAEWEKARALRPAIATLHRNLGLTLLHALHEPERARAVLAEGIAVDRDNVEVYQALDQVLGLLGRPAEERVQALSSYPHRDRLPPSLVVKLALAFLEAGRIEDAEALFPGRFFPREEFGTNVRQVYVEVLAQRALRAARAKDCASARRTIEGLGREVPGLAFTRDGLGPFVDGARTQLLVGDALEACGDAAGARRHWEKAAGAGDVYPYPHLAFAHDAAERLEAARAAALGPKLEAAVAAWTNRLAVGTNFPGANACGQGLMLRALGREPEAEAKLREALLLPDKLMSHYLSRAALAEEGERVARERRSDR
jgi:tetratricopeptide (TPR) repeat protein